jgi:ubiquinone/menaquinone biosynthesis C-methylase UbiE
MLSLTISVSETMSLTPSDWQRRFAQQARWTAELRKYILPRAGLGQARRVIEIGCGSGAILGGIQVQPQAQVFGLDLDPTYLTLAQAAVPGAHLTRADAHHLPFADGAFDLVLCHFLLLWVRDPQVVLAEMARLSRPGGAVLALAEPDYGGRLDYPDALAGLGRKQAQALSQQGANPYLGRRLASLLVEAGLKNIQSGVLGGRWTSPPPPAELAMEWAVLETDLEGVVAAEELARLHALDDTAWERGERILYVPTFYAWGNK